MFPLYDDAPSGRFPWVNSALIAACIAVFALQLQPGDGGERLIFQYGMIPVRLVAGNRPIEATFADRGASRDDRLPREIRTVRRIIPPSPVSPWLTPLTCMFLHGGLMHLVGNLWFLGIFGDNVEDRFGRLGYLMFYLAGGLFASFAHFISDPQSVVPTVGASGAIAAVMGAYLVLLPRANVMALIPLGMFTRVVLVPAFVFHGLWFVFQAVSAIAMSAGSSGVAWWAHLGGFVAGGATALALHSLGWIQASARSSPFH